MEYNNSLQFNCPNCYHHYLVHNDRDFFTNSLINQLLLHFTTNSFSPEPDPVVIRATHWIDVHFTTPVDVNKVAKHCHLSLSQLQRRFKQATGCSLAEYWRMKKLQHAKKLLVQKKFEKRITNPGLKLIDYVIDY